MSTTVTYKGETLTTVENQTRTLQTAGKYLEGDIILTDETGGGGGGGGGVTSANLTITVPNVPMMPGITMPTVYYIDVNGALQSIDLDFGESIISVMCPSIIGGKNTSASSSGGGASIIFYSYGSTLFFVAADGYITVEPY